MVDNYTQESIKYAFQGKGKFGNLSELDYIN